jgi:[ribosomal protein S18]-alanine N-acetyltransferase
VRRCPLLLEAASLEDVLALVDLERRCHSHPWNARHFRDEIEGGPRARVLLLRSPWEPGDPARGLVGYCAYQVVADEMHLLNVAVSPDHRRLGLGRFLVQRAVWAAVRRGVETVFLEVRRSNREARGLYERLGFATLAVRRDYYEDPREDALVLAVRAVEAGLGGRSVAP